MYTYMYTHTYIYIHEMVCSALTRKMGGTQDQSDGRINGQVNLHELEVALQCHLALRQNKAEVSFVRTQMRMHTDSDLVSLLHAPLCCMQLSVACSRSPFLASALSLVFSFSFTLSRCLSFARYLYVI